MMSLSYITPTWPAPENISCFTTTRTGGFSKNQFTSFNLGMHVDDDNKLVDKNRQKLFNDLQLPNEPVWLNQQHSNQIIKITKACNSELSADAAYTNQIEKVCVVQTADCLPVVFCDQYGENIAIAHAGWRGLLNGVIENTLSSFPVPPADILCWLGPAIGPKKFEVGNELRQKFIDKNALHTNAFRQQQIEKYLANIYQLAKNILNINGIEVIYGGDFCTFTDSSRFFSYRRDGNTGRMATLIWRKY